LVGQGSVEKVQHTIAHEMGHIFFGFGHPDEKTGVAPLPGTKHEDRLMVSGGKVSQGILTVKAEWDAADRWLDSRPQQD
jgi:hypothetical protein